MSTVELLLMRSEECLCIAGYRHFVSVSESDSYQPVRRLSRVVLHLLLTLKQSVSQSN